MTDTSNLTQLISALRAETESASISPENLGYILQSIVDFLPNLDDSGMVGDIAAAKANAATALTKAAEALTSANNAATMAVGAQNVANAANATAEQSKTAAQAATAAVESLTALVQALNKALEEKVGKSTKVNGHTLDSSVVINGNDIETVWLPNPDDKPDDYRMSVNDAMRFAYHAHHKDQEEIRELNKLTDTLAEQKAGLNDMGVLASGQEQKLVVVFINTGDKHVEVDIPGVYFNGDTMRIETYEKQGDGMLSITKLIFSEKPSQNVVYCDEGTNTLHRWDGTEMVRVGNGGTVDAYTKAESDNKFANKADTTIRLQEVEEGIHDVASDVSYCAQLNDAKQTITAQGVVVKSVQLKGGSLSTDDDQNLRYDGDRVLVEGDVPEVVQTTGQATDKVMSQKAVTDAIAGGGGGDWDVLADTITTEAVNLFEYDFDKSYKELLIYIYTPIDSSNTATRSIKFSVNINNVNNSSSGSALGIINGLNYRQVNTIISSIKVVNDKIFATVERSEALFWNTNTNGQILKMNSFAPDDNDGISTLFFGVETLSAGYNFPIGTIIKIYGK